ncbi:tRNA (adenosine(37)-N6)-threonylcarbamoyltransferase complex ATPase subunit type 1 TsaE [Methylomonas sp. CM2]|uniref:tRNA (adenosine(37)-N6)-threonylcarbamoyltransferase complex ATPase subunit type 1 TsaE n=1 Tax=Methylomonas sp. CM2 TaxID=3417647 RepID=UPI003CF795C0
MIEIELTDASETEAFGAALWQAMPDKCLMFLNGDLGAGKTTLIRGALRAAGYGGTVKSPTFSLVEEYRLNGRALFHFDLYRLKDPEELEWIGMADYLGERAWCCIEWPEMGMGQLPAADLELTLNYVGEHRVVQINHLRGDWENSIKLHWKNKDLLL